jgi:hypothetical protein
MDSEEICLLFDSNDTVELSSDVLFADSTVMYESGEFHCSYVGLLQYLLS